MEGSLKRSRDQSDAGDAERPAKRTRGPVPDSWILVGPAGAVVVDMSNMTAHDAAALARELDAVYVNEDPRAMHVLVASLADEQAASARFGTGGGRPPIVLRYYDFETGLDDDGVFTNANVHFHPTIIDLLLFLDGSSSSSSSSDASSAAESSSESSESSDISSSEDI